MGILSPRAFGAAAAILIAAAGSDAPAQELETIDRFVPHVSTLPSAPSYAFRLASGVSDWNEIDAVVDWIGALRGAERVSLVGWSMGGMRVGGYAARYPDKVESS